MEVLVPRMVVTTIQRSRHHHAVHFHSCSPINTDIEITSGHVTNHFRFRTPTLVLPRHLDPTGGSSKRAATPSGLAVNYQTSFVLWSTDCQSKSSADTVAVAHLSGAWLADIPPTSMTSSTRAMLQRTGAFSARSSHGG